MEPAAKRPKTAAAGSPPAAAEPAAAASASVAALAALDAQIEPLQNEAAELERRIKELKKQRSKLNIQMAPLRSERQGIAGVLRLLADKPEMRPENLEAMYEDEEDETLREYYEWDGPRVMAVSTLGAAHQRLAIAAVCHARLASTAAAESQHRIELSSDIAEMVAYHIRGFDHVAEAKKFEEFGSEAAEARQQFRPAVLPRPGGKPEVTGFLLEGHRDPKHNGVYRILPEEEEDGWPVLRNAQGICCMNSKIDELDHHWDNAAREGRWCFRAQDVWGGLYGEKTWSFGTDRGDGAAGDGFDQVSLPVGRHTWTKGDGCEDSDDESLNWMGAVQSPPTLELTVTLLLTRREVREAERRLSAQAAAAKASEATSG